MPSGERPDPVRATLVAVLQQLNRVESIHEGQARDQALELEELERLLHRFWAVENDRVKVPLALGLLLRNGLVEVQAGGNRPPKRREPGHVCYRITAEGKRFLVDALARADRIQ
jgi:hypothetical protein